LRILLRIDIQLKAAVNNISIDVFDAVGQIVRRNAFKDANVQAGKKQYTLDLSDFNEGVYTLKVNIDNTTRVKKILVIKD